VLADDGGTIVLGGLISDDRTSFKSGVPVLGDIPILGRLFSSENKNGAKRVLFVFLRPTILRNRTDVAKVSNNRFQRLKSIEAEEANPQNVLRESKPVRSLPLEIDGLY